MIQPKDTEHIESLVENEEKYKPLHSYVGRYNRQIARSRDKDNKGIDQ